LCEKKDIDEEDFEIAAEFYESQVNQHLNEEKRGEK